MMPLDNGCIPADQQKYVDFIKYFGRNATTETVKQKLRELAIAYRRALKNFDGRWAHLMLIDSILVDSDFDELAEQIQKARTLRVQWHEMQKNAAENGHSIPVGMNNYLP